MMITRRNEDTNEILNLSIPAVVRLRTILNRIHRIPSVLSRTRVNLKRKFVIDDNEMIIPKICLKSPNYFANPQK